MLEGVVVVAMGGFGIAVIIYSLILLKQGLIKLYSLTIGKHDDIAKKGRLAFSNDIPIEENPYSTDEYELQDAWLKGWKSAEKSRRKLRG